MLRKLCSLLLLLALSSAIPSEARLTFTQKLRKKAKVQLKQEKYLDILVDGREIEPVAPAPSQKTTEEPKKPAQGLNKPNTSVSNPTQHSEGAGVKQNSTTTTAIGYRIKIFSGGGTRQDKDEAQQAGREFKSLFPAVSVYMHFVSPHWICTAGDFLTQQQAQDFMRQIKTSGYKYSSQMTIVKSKVKVKIQ